MADLLADVPSIERMHTNMGIIPDQLVDGSLSRPYRALAVVLGAVYLAGLVVLVFNIVVGAALMAGSIGVGAVVAEWGLRRR